MIAHRHFYWRYAKGSIDKISRPFRNELWHHDAMTLHLPLNRSVLPEAILFESRGHNGGNNLGVVRWHRITEVITSIRECAYDCAYYSLTA